MKHSEEGVILCLVAIGDIRLRQNDVPQMKVSAKCSPWMCIRHPWHTHTHTHMHTQTHTHTPHITSHVQCIILYTYIQSIPMPYTTYVWHTKMLVRCCPWCCPCPNQSIMEQASTLLEAFSGVTVAHAPFYNLSIAFHKVCSSPLVYTHTLPTPD